MLRREWGIALVLAAGALLRIAAELAYRPALFFPDSWGYLSAAHGPGVVTFSPLRPSGYAVLLKVFAVFGNGLAAATIAQHLGGLLVALLTYVTLRALGIRRGWSALAAAFVALDAWAIALEQFILADTAFGVALALAVWASLSPRRRTTLPIAFAGVCLALATLMKPSAIFAALAWFGWLALQRVEWRVALAGVLAVVIPLLVYSAAHAHVTGTFGITQSDGVFMYGRIGSISTCKGFKVAPAARPLCPGPGGPADQPPNWYIFNSHSPAHRHQRVTGSSRHTAMVNATLRHYARQVIMERPGAYLKLVGADFLRFMRPGPQPDYPESRTVQFPERRLRVFDHPREQRKLFPGLRTHADKPAPALRSYASVVHTSRPLVAIATIISLIALALAFRARDPAAPAIFLTLAMPLLILLGTAATAGFALRYVVPLVAEFTMAATLSGRLLASAARGRRNRRASPLSVREADRS